MNPHTNTIPYPEYHHYDAPQDQEPTFDLCSDHTISPPALPPYCSMGPQDNATNNPYDAPTPASIGADAPYYADDDDVLANGKLQPITTNIKPEQDPIMDGGYVSYVTNPTAGTSIYGASPSSWPTTGATSWQPTPSTQQPFLSPPPPSYSTGPGSSVAAIGQQGQQSQAQPYYDGLPASTTAPEYPDPSLATISGEVAGLGGQGPGAGSHKKKRPHRRSSAGSAGRPLLFDTTTGLPMPGQPQHRATQLRTAQRSSKYSNSSHKPAETVEERKARAMHNQVEQQYRKRLNAQFERLLAALPPEDSSSEERGGAMGGLAIASSGGGYTGGGGGGTISVAVDGEDRRVSKAEVLDRARQRIKILEKERASLERQKRDLLGSVGRLRDEWARRMGGGQGIGA